LIGSTSALTRNAGEVSRAFVEEERWLTGVVGNGHVDSGRRVLLSEDQGLTLLAPVELARLTYRPPQQNPTTPTFFL
jgi:hypothetical protein